jgi:hypothetical protein
MCARVTTVHISNIPSCQKKNFFSFTVAVNSSTKEGSLSLGFLAITICNHGEHYETPRILFLSLFFLYFPKQFQLTYEKFTLAQSGTYPR